MKALCENVCGELNKVDEWLNIGKTYVLRDLYT